MARTLPAIGADVLVLGLAGGRTGDAVAAALGALGVPASSTRSAARPGGPSRWWTRAPGGRPVQRAGAAGGAGEYGGSALCIRRHWPSARPSCCPAACRRGLPPGSLRRADRPRRRGRGARGAGRARGGAAARRGGAPRHRQAEPGRAGGAGRRGGWAARAGRRWPPRRASCGRRGRGGRGLARRRRAVGGHRRGLLAGRAAAGRWPETRPGRATRWPPAWYTGWCSAIRGRNGCGTRSHSARHRRRRRRRASSAIEHYPELLSAVSVTPGPRVRMGPADAGRRDGGDRRAGPRGGARGGRVQRDRHRACRGDRRRRRGRRCARGARGQRELRGLPRRARPDRRGLRGLAEAAACR